MRFQGKNGGGQGGKRVLSVEFLVLSFKLPSTWFDRLTTGAQDRYADYTEKVTTVPLTFE